MFKNFPISPYDLSENDKGFKKVNYAGTGFMCIQRKVFEMILEQYPQIKYKTDVVAEINKKENQVKYLVKQNMLLIVVYKVKEYLMILKIQVDI